MPELAMSWDLKADIGEAAVNLRRSASGAELGKLLAAGPLQVRDQSLLAAGPQVRDQSVLAAGPLQARDQSLLAAGSLQARGQSTAGPWVESCLVRLTAAPAASPTMAKFQAPQVMGHETA
jgi:hypothetical protein